MKRSESLPDWPLHRRMPSGTMENGRNVTLATHTWACIAEPKAVIVFLHGYGAHMLYPPTALAAEKFAAAGYYVVSPSPMCSCGPYLTTMGTSGP